MKHQLVWVFVLLVVAVIGLARTQPNHIFQPSASGDAAAEVWLTNCDEATELALSSPYWRRAGCRRHLSMQVIFSFECHTAPGGCRLKPTNCDHNSTFNCELYIGRDRLIVPRLPCGNVGWAE